jgi:hypothetical protein
MCVALAITPNDELIASCSHSSGLCGATGPATENETRVDLTAVILEALAERLIKQSELQRSATMQHATPTEPGPIPAESKPSNRPIFENSEDKLKHFCRITVQIQKQWEIIGLLHLIAGKTTHASGELLHALAKAPPPKQVVT